MINFNEFQEKKKIDQLKEDILKIGSPLPLDALDEAFNIFLENSPFQQSNWWGNLKAGWQAWKDQAAQGKQNNPIGQNYTALSSALDSFMNVLKQHPVGQKNAEFINSLTSFKQELTDKANQLAQQMQQQQPQQPQQQQQGGMPQQGGSMQSQQMQPNINQRLGMS